MAIDEATARRLAAEALDRAGGAATVYRNPRYPFAPDALRAFEIGPYRVVVRFGEISSPATVEFDGWVFEIREDRLVTLFAPPQ
jgi:hypothetical protein